MESLEGKKAPAFTLEGSDGKKHSIKHWRKVPKAEAHPARVLEVLQSV